MGTSALAPGKTDRNQTKHPLPQPSLTSCYKPEAANHSLSSPRAATKDALLSKQQRSTAALQSKCIFLNVNHHSLSLATGMTMSRFAVRGLFASKSQLADSKLSLHSCFLMLVVSCRHILLWVGLSYLLMHRGRINNRPSQALLGLWLNHNRLYSSHTKHCFFSKTLYRPTVLTIWNQRHI